MATHLLLVSASPGLAAEVEQAFSERETEVFVARDHLEAMLFLDRELCDALLLEIDREGAEGLAFCKVVRRSWAVGVVLLLRPSAQRNVVLGYQMGADSHLNLPFNSRELVARVEGVARRAQISRAERTQVPDTSIPQRLGGVAEIA